MTTPFLHERYVRYSCAKCGHAAHCKGSCPSDPCGCDKCECDECTNKNIEKGQN